MYFFTIFIFIRGAVNFIICLDVSLLAFTKYRYSIVAVNSAGTASSPDVEVTTMAAAPNGVTPLLARVDPDRLNIIYLHWQEPDWPNGEKLCVEFS